MTIKKTVMLDVQDADMTEVMEFADMWHGQYFQQDFRCTAWNWDGNALHVEMEKEIDL